MTRSTDSDDERRTRDRTRRQRTMSISLANRGQTTQDFAVGIGIFILAVAFVFSFLPSIVTPYDSSVGGAETAQADRIADRALEELSSGNGPNDIDPSHDAFTVSNWASSDMPETFGLRTADSGSVLVDRVNVSVQDLNNDDGDPIENPHPSFSGELAFGSEYDDQAAASSARIVTVDGGSEPAYRLVVRVW